MIANQIRTMTYSLLKLLHIASVIIFIGNITTGLFWMHIAVKTKDLKIINHTMKGVIRSDQLFTIPGVIFITLGGFMAAISGQLPILGTGWIFWSIILFSISGVAFMWKVAPLQRKIYNLTVGKETSHNFDWIHFKKAYSGWETWGLIALLTPLAALVMMTLKIPQ